MANIIDYVLWRGDIPVSQVPLGEVDALVLGYLAYMPYGEVLPQGFGGGEMLLGDAAAYFLENSLSARHHIIIPNAWYNAKKNSLEELCQLNAKKKAEGAADSEQFARYKAQYAFPDEI